MSQSTAVNNKKAVARKDMTKAQWVWKEMKRNWVGYVMVAPFLIMFIAFTVGINIFSIHSAAISGV